MKKYDIFKYLDITKRIPNSLPTHFYLSIKEQFIIFSIIMDLFERVSEDIKNAMKAPA